MIKVDLTQEMQQVLEVGRKVLREQVAPDMVRAASSAWPKDSGKSAAGFTVENSPDGFAVVNRVPYAEHVKARGSNRLATDELLTPALRDVTSRLYRAT